MLEYVVLCVINVSMTIYFEIWLRYLSKFLEYYTMLRNTRQYCTNPS